MTTLDLPPKTSVEKSQVQEVDNIKAACDLVNMMPQESEFLPCILQYCLGSGY